MTAAVHESRSSNSLDRHHLNIHIRTLLPNNFESSYLTIPTNVLVRNILHNILTKLLCSHPRRTKYHPDSDESDLEPRAASTYTTFLHLLRHEITLANCKTGMQRDDIPTWKILLKIRNENLWPAGIDAVSSDFRWHLEVLERLEGAGVGVEVLDAVEELRVWLEGSETDDRDGVEVREAARRWVEGLEEIGRMKWVEAFCELVKRCPTGWVTDKVQDGFVWWVLWFVEGEEGIKGSMGPGEWFINGALEA